MWVVYKKSSGGCREEICSFKYEHEAFEFCYSRNWELVDENYFHWNLYYVEEKRR